MNVRFAALSIACAAAAFGCAAEQWGLPRVPLTAVSPDGRFVAFVKNHPNIDPPDQTLWLYPSMGPASQLAEIGTDWASCERIVWSADSQRVAFVIADAIVQVYEAETRRRVFSGFVGRPSRDTPPRYVLRDASLTRDGLAMVFRECERTFRPVDAARQNARGTRVEAVIANCSDTLQTVAFSTTARVDERTFVSSRQSTPTPDAGRAAVPPR